LGVEELRGDESNLWQANMTEPRMCTRDVRTLRKRRKRKKVTMRYKDALDLTECGGHELGGPVPACAARFGIVIFVWT